VVWIFQELAKLFQIFFNMHHNDPPVNVSNGKLGKMKTLDITRVC
jgi:hypothetical protein